MLSTKLEEALNTHLNAEIYSSYLYFSMSSWFRSVNLDGCANWMHVQGLEELSHAKKFYDYIDERGGKVTLAQIDAPPVTWDSAYHVFEETLKHEKLVTSLIYDLVDLGREERDHATEIFLQWFVTEQMEEESSVEKIIEQIKLLEGAPGAMYMLDKELGARNAAALFAQFANTGAQA